MIHGLITSLAQEANTLKEILNDWDEIVKSDLDAMVTCDVLPSCEMLYRCHGLMGYEEETLRKFVTKWRANLEDCQEIKVGITCDLE